MKKKMVILVSILMLLMATVVNAKGKKSKEEKKIWKGNARFSIGSSNKNNKRRDFILSISWSCS